MTADVSEELAAYIFKVEGEAMQESNIKQVATTSHLVWQLCAKSADSKLQIKKAESICFVLLFHPED
jgi:hypothetical protein